MRHLLIGIVISCMAYSVSAKPTEPLNCSYSYQYSEPKIIMNDNEQLVGGMLQDICQSIAKQSGYSIQMLGVPRKRIEQLLIDGTVSLHCLASPKWYLNEQLVWSEPIYHEKTLLLSHSRIDSLVTLSQSNKIQLVGTILGYKYPQLDAYFDSGKLIRVDSTFTKGNVKRFLKGEFPLMVLNQLEASYFIKLEKYHVIELSDRPVHCAISPALSPKVQQHLTKAIETLTRNGGFADIVQRYDIHGGARD